LRRIEDLSASIARSVVEGVNEAHALGRDARDHLQRRGIATEIVRLNDLIGRHNRFYPMEANLPMSIRTGELIDRGGTPWRPMRMAALDDFLHAAVPSEGARGR
jgi:hypothetical protein